MIESLSIQNYGCIQSTELTLTPLHALIGPNDSGKSTLFEAMRLVTTQGHVAAVGARNARTRGMAVSDVASDERLSFEPPSHLEIRISGGIGYRFEAENRTHLRDGLLPSAGDLQQRAWNDHAKHAADYDPLSNALPLPLVLHLDPKALRAASPLFVAGRDLWFMDEGGTGLASMYQGINSRDVDAFLALRNDFRRLFPTVKNLKPLVNEQNHAFFEIELHNGKKISPAGMSEGMLYFLAFAALRYLAPGRLLLIEEPENGLHPSRIAEVVGILRHISKETQVILATHSPLVINELQGHEVSVITRSEESGTKATLLKDTFNYAERSRFYSNGELWLMHADGKEEHDLLHEPEQAQREESAHDPGEVTS